MLATTADGRRLTLDPRPGSCHMVMAVIDNLPLLSEQLAQSRAYGAEVLNRQTITPAERVALQVHRDRATELSGDPSRHLGNVAHQDPEAGQALDMPRAAADKALTEAMATEKRQTPTTS